MATRADRYQAYASVCATVDYASRASVRQHNSASDQMRAIVAEAYQVGPVALTELLPLLNAPPADEWLAFQLLDLGLPPLAIVEQCLAIVRRKAAGAGPDAMGAFMWLQEWEARQTVPNAAAEGGRY